MIVTVSGEDEASPARWQPTRAGILNVWRYYDEVFEFHRGRLLLRGPNGSGKSKVLELLLPYLLDASLKPNRLSTFGGSERTMHWNLMGDGHTGSTRVGYVWLEFAHPGGDGEEPSWFTCGARLQATVNTKSVTAAYFTSGQRVGGHGGLSLTGENGQPLTRAALDEALGTLGMVHGAADEYRTAVRRTLYRGLTEQRYDALLTALRQLRTPKLSERLDPGLLSQLLSSALPPLGEGEIHEIAEGFERLDRQREELRRLDEHVAEAGRLAARQRTYAQRVLRAAAASLISATTTMDRLTGTARVDKEKQARAVAEHAASSARLETEEHREQTLGARIEGLLASPAYQAGHELDELRENARKAEDASGEARKIAERHAADARRRREEAEQAASDASHRRALTEKAREEAARAAERAGFAAAHQEAADCLAPLVRSPSTVDPDDAAGATSRARELLRAATTSREKQIAEVRKAIEAHERARERRAEAEAERDRSGTRLERSVEARETARSEYTAIRKALAAELARWASACRHLAPLDPEALASAVENERDCDEIIFTARASAIERRAAEENALRTRRGEEAKELDVRVHRRAVLAGHTAVAPELRYTHTADRMSRQGGPLWRLVAFAGGVPLPAQAGIEAALEASGLLDAWVMPDGAVLTDEPDTFLSDRPAAPAPGMSLADVLVAEPDTAVAPRVLRTVLSAVALEISAPDIDHPAVVGTDGSWRLGPASGRWNKPEPAFIGATARERTRRRRIQELDAEIEELTARITEIDGLLGRLQEAKAALGAELGDRPSHRPLNTAARALAEKERKVADHGDQLKRDEERLGDREACLKSALNALALLGAEHDLPIQAGVLDGLADAVRDAREGGTVWIEHCTALLTADARARSTSQASDDYAHTAAESAERAAETAARAEALAERVATIDASIGVEHRQVLERLTMTRQEHGECRRTCQSIRTELSDLRERIGVLKESVTAAEQARDDAVAARDRAAARYRHLAAGHLAADAGLGAKPSPDGGVKATLENARAVAATLERTPHEPQHVRDAGARLSEAMHHARDVLADQADLELVPDEDVQILTATMSGVRVGAAELSTALSEERDRRRTDITDKERDLFDRTLAGDTRRHLADRIRQAGDLVDGMNRRLARVRTASQVAVRLVWEVDPQQSAGIRTARQLLLRDPAGLGNEDKEALYRFFRDRVEEARAANTAASWEEQLMQVLDYTAWHRFTVRLERADGKGWQDLTRKLHGALSGGEKAIALHLPLFAAVAAHYQTDPRCPRFILLDEVFVGVDTTNRGQVFDLLVSLGLDLVLTSDHEWCDYRELDGIAIHQLITGADGDGDNAVTTARFIWDGHRTLPADDGLFPIEDLDGDS
ncbi:TIGR02680 family protein [Actinomadura sp. NPDC023710]|uniref:TIGR02680 family protein n=1 Tax=Actinomadura sp. NPDC023710 TaxID=3158219 RepID=UPI0033ED9F50